jgi:hypothetical protein
LQDLSPTSSDDTTATAFSLIDVADDFEASIEFADHETRTSAATEPSKPMMKPIQPIMGGLSQVSSVEWTAWTDGKPTHDWTGLAGTVETFGSPNQLRPNSAAYAQKGYQFQSTGLTEKFKRSDDLATFIREVKEHMDDCGLDTITYLPSPTDANSMCCVLTNYSKFTTDTACIAGELI